MINKAYKNNINFKFSEKETMRMQEKSNSKETITLEKEKNNFYIKKTWNDIERGCNSIQKQINFDEIKISALIIKSPKVFRTEISDEQFTAKMEYIDGYSGDEIIRNGSRIISQNLKNSLSTMLSLNFEHSEIKKIKTEIFNKKINQILSLIKSDNEISSLIKSIKEEINRHKFIEIPIGPCHGDLTLSNIIVSPSGSINIIDFLPTFIESPFWDIAKLIQDLEYGWSFRKTKGARKASSKILFKSCMPSQVEIYKKCWRDEIKYVNAVNLARLAPYIKDKESRDWLLFYLKESLIDIEK